MEMVGVLSFIRGVFRCYPNIAGSFIPRTNGYRRLPRLLAAANG